MQLFNLNLIKYEQIKRETSDSKNVLISVNKHCNSKYVRGSFEYQTEMYY